MNNREILPNFIYLIASIKLTIATQVTDHFIVKKEMTVDAQQLCAASITGKIFYGPLNVDYGLIVVYVLTQKIADGLQIIHPERNADINHLFQLLVTTESQGDQLGWLMLKYNVHRLSSDNQKWSQGVNIVVGIAADQGRTPPDKHKTQLICALISGEMQRYIKIRYLKQLLDIKEDLEELNSKIQERVKSYANINDKTTRYHYRNSNKMMPPTQIQLVSGQSDCTKTELFSKAIKSRKNHTQTTSILKTAVKSQNFQIRRSIFYFSRVLELYKRINGKLQIKSLALTDLFRRSVRSFPCGGIQF